MPVYNSRDLIPFVNNLEVRIDGMVESIESWDASKGKIMTSMRDIEGNKSRSSLAMAKADEALQEISSATYDATVGRGSRLKEIIDNLKDEMIEVAIRSVEAVLDWKEYINALNNGEVEGCCSVKEK